MAIDELAWTVEEACRNAFPSIRQIRLDGWLLRASGGSFRKTNSVNPLRYGPRDPSPIVASAEAICASLGHPTIFRVPALVPEMEKPLERRGYMAEGETRTLFADLSGKSEPSRLDVVELCSDPALEWYEAWASLNGASPSALRLYRATIDAVILPKTFACCRMGEEIISVGYGVLHGRLLVLEAIATHSDHRNRGHGRRIVEGLIDWGRRHDAEGACLQVQADNTPGQALYKSAGFWRELYRYHYRRNGVAARQSKL